jgi:hypothetical protein
MAVQGFRYPFDVQSTLDPWRHQLGENFDQVVATLADRDRSLEDFLGQVTRSSAGYFINPQLGVGETSFLGLEPIETGGTASGISMVDRDNTAARWVILPNAGTLQFYDGTATRVSITRTTGVVDLITGGLNLHDHVLSLRTLADGNSLFYDANNDIATLQGFSNVRLRTLGTPQNWTFASNGNATFPGSLFLPGVLSGTAGVAGATMRTRSGGNTYSFDWGSPFTMWVDVTNVKTFVIDHPQDAKKHLIHATLEGPENGVYYRGEGRLEGRIEDGRPVDAVCTVELPPYFEALCAEEGRSVQITPIADSAHDEWCPVLHATYPKDGKFQVGLGSGVVVHDQRFWWEVKAIRKDVPPLLVEPKKSDVDIMGSGPYRWYNRKGQA